MAASEYWLSGLWLQSGTAGLPARPLQLAQAQRRAALHHGSKHVDNTKSIGPQWWLAMHCLQLVTSMAGCTALMLTNEGNGHEQNMGCQEEGDCDLVVPHPFLAVLRLDSVGNVLIKHFWGQDVAVPPYLNKSAGAVGGV